MLVVEVVEEDEGVQAALWIVSEAEKRLLHCLFFLQFEIPIADDTEVDVAVFHQFEARTCL